MGLSFGVQLPEFDTDLALVFENRFELQGNVKGAAVRFRDRLERAIGPGRAADRRTGNRGRCGGQGSTARLSCCIWNWG